MLRAKPATKRSALSPSSPAAASVRWIHWYAVPIERTSDAAIEATPSSAPFIGSRLPNRMMRAKATPGISGISQAFSMNQPAGSSCHVIRCISLSSSRAMERRLR